MKVTTERQENCIVQLTISVDDKEENGYLRRSARALARSIEGYCVVQYVVTQSGTIRDPFVVEGQCTSSLFHRASLQASLKFKYKPRVVDGEAVEVPGVQNKFTYEINE